MTNKTPKLIKYKTFSQLSVGDTVYATDGRFHFKKVTIKVKESLVHTNDRGEPDGHFTRFVFSDGWDVKIHDDTPIALTNKIGVRYKTSIKRDERLRYFTTPKEARAYISETYGPLKDKHADMIKTLQNELEIIKARENEILAACK